MARDLNEKLTVEVRLLTEPCLRCWEIRDRASGELMESSWTAGWEAYDSREEARMAGQTRLVLLLSRLEQEAAPGQVVSAGAGARRE